MVSRGRRAARARLPRGADESILPLASVLTPNLAESRALAGHGANAEPVALAAEIRELGPAAVIVTGGHAGGTDVLDDGSGAPLLVPGVMHPGGAAHGSGCTHSSSLAALLALGVELREASMEARAIAADAIGHGLREIGSGPGPVDVLGIAATASARRPGG